MSRVETIAEGVTLYLGDCREILPTLGKVDAVVTDPPYGIGNWGGAWDSGGCGRSRLWNETPDWDQRPSQELLESLIQTRAIIWGGNYFNNLPVSKGWLVWDKASDMTQAQAELAWSNVVPNVRVHRLSPLGVFGNFGNNGEVKDHPTQKPTELMVWCLQFLKKTKLIVDPFMGSGSTGVAAIKLGLKFTGIEIDPGYFDTACRRIAEATKQQDLFIEKPKPARQEAFEL